MIESINKLGIFLKKKPMKKCEFSEFQIIFQN